MPENPLQSKFEQGTRRDPQVLGTAALFPPSGQRYLSATDIEELRQLAWGGEDVTMPARTAMEIVCDLVNMASELEAASQRDCSPKQGAIAGSDGGGAGTLRGERTGTGTGQWAGGSPGPPTRHRLSNDALEAIEARATAATQGPWEVLLHEVQDYAKRNGYAFVLGYVPRDANGHQRFHELNVIKVCHQDWAPTGADADFIAHAREDVPGLAAEVRRLRGGLEELEQHGTEHVRLVARAALGHREGEDRG